MARQDIAGLLTGMPTQRPDPSMGREQWAMAFGQQQADRVGQGLRGLTGATTAREQAGIADLKAQERIGKLATSQDPDELRQAAQLLQQRGDPAGAARAAAQAKAIEDKKASATQISNTRKALVERLKDNPKFENVIPLINNGVFDADFKQLLPLLMPDKKGSSMIKPFAATDKDGNPIMLTVTSKHGQDDAVTLINGSPAPVGSTITTAAGTTVNVDLGAEADGEMLKYLGQTRGKQIIEETQAAKATLLTTQVIQDQWNIISSEAGVFTGMGAESIQLPLSKVLMKAGLISKDTEKALENTEVFIANSGNLVAEVIKNFGAGTGLSDADREFAKGIVGGTVALSEASLKRLIKIQARASIRKIRMHNENIKTLPAGVQGWGLDVKEPENYDWAFKEDVYDIQNKKTGGKAWDFNSVGTMAETAPKRPAAVQAALDKYSKKEN